MRYSIFSKENIKIFATFIIGYILIVFPISLIASATENGFVGRLKEALINTGWVAAFFTSFFLTIGIIGWIVNLLAHTTVRVQKLDKVDFLGSKELYRDILETYSPVTLSYIDQMNYDPVVAVTAGLLRLENKKYIKLNNGEIEFLKEDDYNMSMSERYIYGRLKRGKKEIEAKTLWNDILYDGYKSGILEEHRSTMDFKIIGRSALLLFALSIFANILKGIFGKLGEGLGALVVILVWGFFCAYQIYNEEKSGYRTNEAIELNSKLEGLKTFLKEYSTLHDRDSDEIVLWEDYLIYSVIFRQNKKIISEYKKYFKII